MRVLHAADFGGVAAGGFIPLIATLARRLTARGDEFAFVVPFTEGATWYPLVREAGAELHVVRDAAQAARLARAWRPDVAHVHFFGWELPLTFALWATPARIFWHAHSTSLQNGRIRRSARSLAKYRLAGRRVTRFVTVTKAIAGELEALGAPRARIIAIPNAVDAARFSPPAAAQRAAARAELALDDDERAVLFFGRDPQIKGADVLAAALASAPISGRRVAVVTVATPQRARDALAPHARVIAIERTDDVRSLLWACDALALPSRGEGFAFVLVEAALAGLPVAASDLPALRESAGAHRSVEFAAAGDAAAFAAALERALATPHALASDPPAGPTAPNDLERWAAAIEALY